MKHKRLCTFFSVSQFTPKIIELCDWCLLAPGKCRIFIGLKDFNEEFGEKLINATKTGTAKDVNVLIEKKSDINYRDENGDTPLSKACNEGNYEIVDLLLSANADPNINRPLEIAKSKIYEYSLIIEKLTQMGAH